MEDKKRRTIQDGMDDYEGFEFDHSSNEEENDDSFLVGAINKITKGVEELEDEDTEKRD